MPYLPQQHRLFEAAAHDPEIARRRGIPMATAARMAGEGIKQPDPKRTVVQALMSRVPRPRY